MGLFSKKTKTVVKEYYSGDSKLIEKWFRGENPPEEDELYDVVFEVTYSYGSDDWGGYAYVYCSGVKNWEINKICNLNYSDSCDWARAHGVTQSRLDGVIKVSRKYPYKEGEEFGFCDAYKGAGL